MSARIVDFATPYSFIWIIVALSSFAVGTLIARPLKFGLHKQRVWSDDRAYKALLVATAVVVTVSSLWVGVTIAKVGLGKLLAIAGDDNSYAREIILNSSFPGGRVISNGYMGIFVFSLFYLAKKRLTRLDRGRIFSVLSIAALAAIYLGLMPILVSGRINFFMAVIGAYVAISLSHGKMYRVQYLPIAVAVLCVVWGAKEYYALRHVMEISPFEQSTQSFLFYVYNDITNSINPVGNIDGRYSYGWESLRFAFYFTFTEDYGIRMSLNKYDYVSNIKVAGEIPMLTAPYVDFGFFGILILVAIGYFSKTVYYMALRDIAFAPMYGIVFASLALSVHACYITSQDAVFNLIMVFLLATFAFVAVRPNVSS